MTTSAILPSKMSSHLSRVSTDYRSKLDTYLAYEKRMSLLKGRYQFLEYLQNGSFGKVSCALDMATNTKVAIKSMKKTTNEMILMARQEISIMQLIGKHPNSVQLIESFETKKFIILVLEFVDSGDLYDAVHNQTNLGKLIQNDEKTFVSLVSQLVEIIQFAHSKGIYHRDIKPENVLLMKDGTVKLCDWGLSITSIDCYEFNVGTEKYMPPEALSRFYKPTGLTYDAYNGYSYDSKLADVWSFGITLLFALFGKCPFRKASLEKDTNFQKFCKSKSFLYDYYPNMNTTTFDAIVETMLNERDLIGGVKKIQTVGLITGFTLDQEYRHHDDATAAALARENVIVNANANANANVTNNADFDVDHLDEDEEGQFGGEMFMFDEENDMAAGSGYGSGSTGVSAIGNDDSSTSSYSSSEIELPLPVPQSSSKLPQQQQQQQQQHGLPLKPSDPITISTPTQDQKLKELEHFRVIIDDLIQNNNKNAANLYNNNNNNNYTDYNYYNTSYNRTMTNGSTPASPSIFDNAMTKITTTMTNSTNTNININTNTNLKAVATTATTATTNMSYSDEKFMVPMGRSSWFDDFDEIDVDLDFNGKFTGVGVGAGFNLNVGLGFNGNVNGNGNGNGEDSEDDDGDCDCDCDEESVGSVHNKNYNFIQLKKRLA
ncbi:unnamed protein product [Ambrosiozyma monospora]|uniref:non-specific serine/threonine protein kinase n=1 Tax=Ambrosiozyma monospora TaxID=43982 RepID=A0A9W6YTM0_AMBMO|nr:unnamed protein product [Ambrosiozyma monospora]